MKNLNNKQNTLITAVVTSLFSLCQTTTLNGIIDMVLNNGKLPMLSLIISFRFFIIIFANDYVLIMEDRLNP